MQSRHVQHQILLYFSLYNIYPTLKININYVWFMIPKLDQISYRLKMSNLGEIFYGETAGIQMDVLNDRIRGRQLVVNLNLNKVF